MRTFAPVLLLALGLGACADETGPSSRVAPTKDEGPSIELLLVASRAARTALSGGALTVFDVSADAFSFAAPGLAGARLAQHDEGDDAFETVFGQGLGSNSVPRAFFPTPARSSNTSNRMESFRTEPRFSSGVRPIL